MHYYKRLLPEQIVHLREGAEVIAVIPLVPKSPTKDEIVAYKTVTKALNNILLDSCEGLRMEERKEELEMIHHA